MKTKYELDEKEIKEAIQNYLTAKLNGAKVEQKNISLNCVLQYEDRHPGIAGYTYSVTVIVER